MTILQRAATIAVMTFSLAGLLGNSAPGKATGLDRSTTNLTALANLNALSPQNVPQIAPVATPVAAVEPIATNAATAEAEEFDTLAQAVAAQDSAAADDALQCLAGAIYFESKGEPLTGQLAVAEVIINRAKSGRFPADVCAVVKQRGQFSFVRGGQIPTINAGTAYRTAIAVAKVALADAWNSPAEKALYFNTADRRPSVRAVKVASIGNHVFYR
ncbi:cell wall hydrolase [Sphingomonas sp. Leaf28]|jgi:N-acetylmuramoyl-L-alanine amidase|uniref:cell wall hydrolase n=2 Tax=Sphingomonas TaxID=13687 RepID=UPI0006FBE7FC|nr:cell wall hydrolase [Sphingomonas sp. Leaf28]KQN08292.1 cell wall hydrolase [Sphingomonas sp. Leaf28]